MTVSTENIAFSPQAPFTPPSSPWPELGHAALRGLAGDVVRLIEPHSESDPAALLIQFLAAFGSAAGREAGVRVEADRHNGNLFVLLVGESSKGRKGSSRRQATRPLELTDPGWAERITAGLVSGEGLIYEVRDAETERRKARTKAEREEADEDGYVTIEVDPGAEDKRCLIVESEFASTLKVMGRDGSTLSSVVRQAWDGGTLRTMAKNSPTKSTGGHVSIIGHITADELQRELRATDAANGFANRFLIVCSRRSKLLPLGGGAHTIDWKPIVRELSYSLRHAGVVGDMAIDKDAIPLWEAAYASTADGRPGMLGAVTARGEAQTLRLALLYALLDRADSIRTAHIEAGLAVWRYCEASAAYLFGDQLGDKLADRLLGELRERPNGMTRTDIRELLGNRIEAEQIDASLRLLAEHGLARSTRQGTGGRPVERWFAEVEKTEITEQSLPNAAEAVA